MDAFVAAIEIPLALRVVLAVAFAVKFLLPQLVRTLDLGLAQRAARLLDPNSTPLNHGDGQRRDELRQ